MECDLTGLKSKKIHIEKIYSKMLEYFDENAPQHITQSDKNHLETLKGIITNQTATYKQKHSGKWGACVLWWRKIFRGDIDRLSQDLLVKVDALEKLTRAPRNLIDQTELRQLEDSKQALENQLVELDPESVQPIRNQIDVIDIEIQKLKDAPVIELHNRRKEFLTAQTSFAEAMESAAINIKILIQLCDKRGVQCDHPLFKDREKLNQYDELYGEFSTLALTIKGIIEKALIEDTDISKSESIAKIYKTDVFAEYVEKATAAAHAYSDELVKFIPALSKQNVFTHEDIAGFDFFGQQPSTAEFVYSANNRIEGTLAAVFARPFQHIMRHADLMDALEKNTPYEAPEYELVLEGAIEAKRSAKSMDFS